MTYPLLPFGPTLCYPSGQASGTPSPLSTEHIGAIAVKNTNDANILSYCQDQRKHGEIGRWLTWTLTRISHFRDFCNPFQYTFPRFLQPFPIHISVIYAPVRMDAYTFDRLQWTPPPLLQGDPEVGTHPRRIRQVRFRRKQFKINRKVRHPDIAPCHCRTPQGTTRQLRTVRCPHVAPCDVRQSHLAASAYRTLQLTMTALGL